VVVVVATAWAVAAANAEQVVAGWIHVVAVVRPSPQMSLHGSRHVHAAQTSFSRATDDMQSS
jgi:hypothetical protein